MIDQSIWEPPRDLKKKELLVVACTSHFFSPDYVSPVTLPAGWDCDLKCDFSADLGRIDEADALWFHGPSVKWLPEKKADQKWIVTSMESDVNYPFMKEKRVMDLFDIHVTYRLDSDVPLLYPSWHQYGSFLNKPLPIEIKNSQRSPVLYSASNPVPYRDDYVKQLMQRIDIDSVGKCLNNLTMAELPGWGEKGGFDGMLDLIRHYKFYIAFENSHTTDYVTERIFQALSAGSVPVYFGAENVLEFLPDEKAIINARDFSGVEDLAEYLKYLDEDDEAYMQHLAWKTEGYSDEFKHLVDISSIEPLQRMFIKLAHGCGHECWCGGRLR